MKKFLFFLMSLFLLVACSPQTGGQAATEAQPSPEATVAPPSTATAVPAMMEAVAFSLVVDPGNSGSVVMDGTGTSSPSYLVGDDAENKEWRTFLAFGLSGMQAGVQKATLHLSCNVVNGSPADLGGVRVALFPIDSPFDPLAASNSSLRGVEDIFGELTCPGGDFDVTEALQRLLRNEESAFGIIVASVDGSDFDGTQDMLEIIDAQLDVDYRAGAAVAQPATQTPTQAAPVAASAAQPTTQAALAETSAACTDVLQFVTDLGVQDNDVFDPLRVFTKGWRLKNVGTCTWDETYSVAFIGGEQMKAPNSIPLPGVVPPGGTVDVYVDLVAPKTEGTHQGTFELRNSAGQTIGTPFWVKIVVKSTRSDTGGQEQPTPQPETFTVEPNYFNSGSFSSNGAGGTPFYVGDDEQNAQWVTVLDFGMNDIQPMNVYSATLELDCAPVDGDFFPDLGGFEVGSAVYGDFVMAQNGSNLRMEDIQLVDYIGNVTSRCVPVAFDVTASLQNYFGTMVGSSPYQIVITPLQQTDGDNIADRIQFPSVRLVISGTP